MPTPDNRIRLPATLIDFANDVGVASQSHDNYPPPQGQARFDHMRMFLIGLLSQQSSFDEPTEFRDGTPWFDLNTLMLKINKGGEWVSYAEIIELAEDVSLANWYAEVSVALTSISQEVVFNGVCTVDGITEIAIPESLQQFVASDTRCFLYINQKLIDPRNCSIVASTTIRIVNATLDDGDTFTVALRRIPASSFHTQTVSVP